MKHLRICLSFFLLFILLCPTTSLRAQNFRGSLNGTVTDSTGATLANASVVATNVDTGVSRTTVSSSAGEFAFQDLPLGNYTVTVTDPGFATGKYEKITVSAGQAYTLPVSLTVSSSLQTVEVIASGVSLDTTSSVQTTDIPSLVVNDAPTNGRDFTQFLQYTPGFAGYSIAGGAGVASINGTRSNQVNWQIEGTDNNDLWWNIPAVNQGGVSGIAGVVIPLDAIDQFSFVTSGMPETGRNAGGTVNLSIKSGTNVVHGTAYYYNRNEAFAANTPFAAPGSKKNETRDIDYGASVGGSIIKDKLFYFVSYEHQNFVIGAAAGATEPSQAYQAFATDVLNYYGIPVSPVSTALLANLWPASALNGPAQPDNYFNPGTENGHSFNPLVKIDYDINPSNTLSVKGYMGDGNQTAPVGSELSPYFEVAPIHVDNYSVIYNHIFSPRFANQAFFGVSYFDQVFSDAVHSYNPVALGLNTGVTDPTLSGAPHLSIAPSAAASGLTGGSTGFDLIGATAPEGRQDITGQFDDVVSYSVGKHEIRAGGEFRKAQVDDFYQTGARGNFVFDGSQGPYASAYGLGNGSPACEALGNPALVGQPYNGAAALPQINGKTDSNVFLLADFMAGCISQSTIAEGNQKRMVYENTWDIFAQDAWQITQRLNLNYGVRYDYAQAVHNSDKNLTSFDAAFPSGFAIQGENVSNIYTPYKGSISPRVGGSFAATNKMTVRGGFGVYFDTVYMLSLLNLRGTTDNGALGLGNNLAGADPVVTAQVNSAVIVSGQPIFPTLAQAQAGAGVTNAYSVNPNYRPSYTYSYNLNVEQQFGSKVVAQLGYLGTLSRKLTGVLDINPEAVGSNENQTTRPYYAQFPNIGNVNQLESNLNANYNSLQASVRTESFYGLTSQFDYTWSHALDYETGLIPYLPQNSLDVKAEYGNSDFDTRNTFAALLNYKLPTNNFKFPRLSNGWEFNSSFAMHGGQPFSVVASYDASGNGDGADRDNIVPGVPVFAGVSHAITYANGGSGSVTWFNSNAFTDPAPGTFGNERRNQYYNPGFSDIDFSVVKNTRITGRVTLQLRAEMFNIVNHINLAPVGAPQTGAGGTIGSTIGTFFGAPGIGPGEPFNTQFAGKIIF